MFKLIEQTTYSDRSTNEDLVRFQDSLIVLLDGSSGLGKNLIATESSDAKWFVDEIVHQLINQSVRTGKLRIAVRNSIENFRSRYATILKKFANEYKPSASLALVKATKKLLQVFVLGDCFVWVSLKNGQVIEITDHAVKDVDESFFTLCQDSMKQENISFKEAVEKHRQVVVENRKRKNSIEGYWILSDDLKAADYGVSKEFKSSEVQAIFACSDGFELVRQINPKAIEMLFETEGSILNDQVDELVDFLHNDAQFERIHRYKDLDDITAIFVKQVES